MHTRLTASLLGVLLALSTAACAARDDIAPSAAGPVRIGFITKFPGDFYDTMASAARTYDAQHNDVEITFRQGTSGTDDESQIGFIEAFTAQKVNAIVITPASPNVQTALDKAVAAGIKVVLVDNDLPGWSGKSTVVATNNLAGGKLAGAWLAEHLAAGANVAVLQGRLGNPSLDERVSGMKTGLAGKAQVVAEVVTDCDQAKGRNATLDILAEHPDVAAIYGACGPPALGALEAIKASGKKTAVMVVGFDALAGELTAINAGQEAGSVAQFPARMGTMGVQAAVDAARGKKLAAKVDTGTEMVTKANVGSFT
jgi:ABC-type sugar transport system substrate-binding protein